MEVGRGCWREGALLVALDYLEVKGNVYVGVCVWRGEQREIILEVAGCPATSL